MDKVTPPDLQVAGAAQPNPDAQSLVGMLGSHGSMPSGLMEALRPQQAMTPGAVYGAAAAGGLNPSAPNPVLAQHMQGQNAIADQSMRQAEMMERVQERRTKAELEKNKVAWTVLSGIINNPRTSDEARQALLPQYKKQAKQFLGIDLPNSALDRAISHEDRNKMLRDMHSGMDPQMLKRAYPWIKDADIPMYTQMLKNPEALRQIGAKTTDELAMDAMKLKGSELDLIAKQHPELRDPKIASTVSSLHQKWYAKPYMEGTAETRAQVADMAHIQLLKEEEAKEARQEAMRMRLMEQSNINAENRMILRDALSEGKKKGLADEKKKRGIAVGKTFLNQMEDLAEKLDQKGFLPKGVGAGEYYRAAAKQGRGPVQVPMVSQYNDPDWRAWLELQGNMIGFARDVQGDIGPRAIAAFKQAISVSENPPPAKAMKQIIAQMRNQITAAETGEGQEAVSTSPLDPGKIPPPPDYKKK